jgi:polyhydroxybutyrate depolymerase
MCLTGHTRANFRWNRIFFFSTQYLLIVAFFAACSQSNTDLSGTLDVDGVVRSYLLHVPRHSGSEAMPLVLAFHGGGGTGRSIEWLTGFDKEADENQFLVAYPDGLDKGWNDGRQTAIKSDDIGFVSRLIDRLAAQYRIDPDRVYAAGISSGGMFCFRLGCQLSRKIVAIAAVAASMPLDIAENCNPELPISVAIFSGTADPLMPFDGGEIGKLFGRFGRSGLVLSASATYLKWMKLERCSIDRESLTLPERHPRDGTRVEVQEAVNGKSTTAVILFTIVNGGHAWPGGPQYLPENVIGKASNQIMATEAIVTFFLRHPRASWQ